MFVSPNTDIPALENEFIFKYQYVFLYNFHGMTCLYQRTLLTTVMLFELCDRGLCTAQSTVMMLGTDVLFLKKQDQKKHLLSSLISTSTMEPPFTLI